MQNTQQLALHIDLPVDVPETDEVINTLSSPTSIASRELRIIGDIQKGSFGVVKMGFWKTKPVAIKILKDNSVARNEAKLHHQFRHSNIVLLLAVSQSPGEYWMILEKMDGDLLDYINDHPNISFTEKLNFAIQITSGVEYLHNVAHVLHRDLKNENVLMRNGQLKIADFGISVPINEPQRSPGIGAILGPWQGYAPELINKKAFFTLQTDIFALGILLNELLTGHCAYPDVRIKTRSSILKKLTKVAEGERPPVDPENTLTPIVENCWAHNPDNRPLISDLLSLLLRVSTKEVCLSRKAETKPVGSPLFKHLKLLTDYEEGASPKLGKAW